MSLKFIMGPSGSGKSHYLYEWVTTESWKHPNKNYIVIVPEQFTLQTQKDLVMASPRKGILNVEVQSFHRLATRIFEETGENRRMILNDIGKNFVIRKVAGNREEELKVLGSNLKKLGYISEIKSIISEFTQYDIQPDTLELMLERAEKTPALCYKLQDIKTIYEGFREYLKEKYITGEEVLDVLALVAHKSKLLKNSVIVLDGFTGFTPVQMKLLRELMHVCEKVVVTVTIGAKENPYVCEHPYQLFALSKEMTSKLIQIARVDGVEVEEPVELFQQPIYRFRDNEALAFLENRLFRYSNETYKKEQDAVRIYCAKSPQEEVDFVAQSVRKLVRKEGYHYRDIAVITNGMDAYANHIERIFACYDIPIFMDHKRSILLNSCVEYIRSLLAMVEQNFSYESVFRYLRTGFSGISVEEVDILENYVLALGIRGYKKWQEKWIRRTRHMDENMLSEVNRIRVCFMDSIQEITDVLKDKNKTVFHVTSALHAFFLKMELQKHVKEYQMRFEQEGRLHLAKEYAQVYRIIIELLEQFVELLGEEKISLKEYCDLLDAGLQEAKVGVAPPSVDQVVVGDVERSRIKDVKTVFLLGVNDMYIPGNTDKHGLLSEYDRTLITESGTPLAPNAKEKIYIQKFYLYLILTKPTHQVYLTYSKTSGDGKNLRPAYLISDLLRIFDKLKVREVSGVLEDKELTPESAIKYLVGGLQKKSDGLSTQWQELFNWYKKQPQWQEKLTQILEAAFYQKPEHTISRETAKKLYGEILENSVTRLEQFSACAYSHFLQYGLRLNEREEYQFRALDLGNLFHSSIEKFSVKLEKEGFTWNNIPTNKQEELIRESIDECIVDYGNSILYSSARNEYIIRRLTRMLTRTVWALKKQLERGDFVPGGYEISFGGHKALRVSKVNLGELGELRLRGKIDRVDLCEDGDKLFVKVVDYKTGTEKFDWNRLCYGLQLQLIVYMNAALEMQRQEHPDKEVVPAGIFYYQMQDPIVEKGKGEKEIEDAILEELCPNGLVQNDEEVIFHLDKQFTKKSQVIPVTKNKGGDLRASANVVSAEEFATVSQFVDDKVKDIGTRILKGEADAAPYELDGATGCKFCPYHTVCGFEEKIPGYEYRKMDKLKPDEILEKMKKEVGPWE